MPSPRCLNRRRNDLFAIWHRIEWCLMLAARLARQSARALAATLPTIGGPADQRSLKLVPFGGPTEFTKKRSQVASVGRPNVVQLSELTRTMETQIQPLKCGIPPVRVGKTLSRPERIPHLFFAPVLLSHTDLRPHVGRAERIIDSHLRNGTACEIRSASFLSPP